jgi:hypothetical protein
LHASTHFSSASCSTVYGIACLNAGLAG